MRFLSEKLTGLRSEHGGRRAKLPLLLAILSVLIIIVAFVLAMLCLFAGNHPNFMEDYAIFTLNVSRIGENLEQKLDKGIEDINIKRSLKPMSVSAPVAIMTPAPSTLIQVRAPLDIPGLGKLTSEAGGAIHSVESAAKGEATGLVDSAKAEAIKGINDAYNDIVHGLDLKDFYSLHMMTTCEGTYVTSSGKNITVGGNVMADNGTHEHVDSCETHSAIDPLQLARIVYIIGIAFIGATLICAGYAVYNTANHRLVPIGNFLASGLAFAIIGLVSGVTHGVSVGASKLINFIGNDIGVAGYAGYKFLASTWATTGLLGVNAGLWIVSWYVRHKEAKKAY